MKQSNQNRLSFLTCTLLILGGTLPTTASSKLEEKSTITPSPTIKTIHIALPKTPEVPLPITVNTVQNKENNVLLNRSIKFSKRVPPNWDPDKYEKMEKKDSDLIGAAGEVSAGRISAYLRGSYINISQVEKQLKSSGFEILTTAYLDKEKNLASVVFTNKDLLTMASKKNRGFISNLRVLIDNKNKRISITNPLYFSKAFLQSEFDERTASKTLATLNHTFNELKNSTDSLKYQLLPSYQLMKGLPRYEDILVVAKGNDLETKLAKNPKILFMQKLENGAILAGVDLGRNTSQFIQKIGTKNAALLPYPMLIENGKAKILDPKYYIAVMYPQLKMSEFMTIATIPDAITKDCQSIFQ